MTAIPVAFVRYSRVAVSVLLFSVCLAFPVFAQKAGPESRVTQFLAKSDIDAFIKNHKAIRAELAKAGISESDFGFDSAVTPDFDTLNFLNSIKTPTQADAIFAKYGMGKNGMRKLFVMNWAAEVAIFERLLKPGSGESGMMDAGTYATLMEKYYDCINPEDLKLVRPRCDELSEIFLEDGISDGESASATEAPSPWDFDEAAEPTDGEPEDSEYDSSDEDEGWFDSDEEE